MPGSFIEECEKRRLLAGVTLFIPAWDGGLTGWIDTQAAAITKSLGGPSAVPEYTLTVAPTSTNGPLAGSISHVAGTATPQTGTSGQIMLILDYTSVSTNPNYALSYVASVATNVMENTVIDGIRISELPLHEISLSRGTGEEDEIAKSLDQSGIWVEQETYLDPHPVPSIGDAPNAVYDNVEFADEYWRTTGYPTPNLPGEVNSFPVAGAYQSNVQSEQDDFSGTSFAHLGMGGYYTGTIDQITDQGGDGLINSDWYGDGYPARDQTGFYYSAIVGGTRPLSGVWAASGGSGTRTAVTHSGTQWPNVGDVALSGTSTIPAGTTLNIHYIQQDSSNAATITFSLDTDADPYNNNNAATLGTVNVAASSSVKSGVFTASTSGLAPGTYYIGAEINDGQGRYRYSYSQPIVITKPATTRVQLSGTPIGTPGSYANDGQTIADVFDGNLNTFFDGPDANGDWVGLDLGSPQYITAVSFAPRIGVENGDLGQLLDFSVRLQGGTFQASNDPTFSTGVVDLYTIPNQPGQGLTTVATSDVGAYRYVRYIGAPGTYCNIAEMQVFGSTTIGTSDTQAPTQPGTPTLTAPATTYGVSFTWNPSSDNVGVDHYNVYRNGTLLGSTINNTYTDLTAAAGTQYTYAVQAADTAGNLSTQTTLAVTTAPPIVQLSGTPIGTTGSYNNNGDTLSKAFDGDTTTYFDGPTASGDWVGLDLGAQYNIYRVVYAPAPGDESAVVGGIFQGSNDPTFTTGVVNLATVTSTPLDDGYTGFDLGSTGPFRYVRYLAPAGSYGEIAEFQVFGQSTGSAPVDTTPPTATLASANAITAATTSAYTFTVNYADNVAVSASTLGNQDILVTGPNGYNAAATLTSTGLSNNSSISATYSIPAPAGGWTSASNGSYTIALQANQVSDTSGNFAAAGNLGTFSVGIALADTTPPKAAIASAPTLNAATTSAYTFTINYTDNVAVNASTLNNQDLLVTGPNGYSAAATLTSTGLSNSSSITATYTVPAPAGGWTSASNGSYTIALQANQVSDTSGNFAAAANLGTFSVNIAATITGTGALSGLQSVPAASYNLTTLGTEDWAHWGRGGTFGNFDHKATGGSKISNITVVGSGATSGGYSTNSRTSVWTDGSPTATDTAEHGYIWSNGANNTGFQFTVPASTTTQTLYVYAGGSGTTSSLTAHLSDSSSPDYVATASGSGSYTNFYTITFKAASAGQTLTITLLKTATITPGGSVDLIAAALAGPAVADTTPPAAALASAPTLTSATTSVYTFTVNYTDNVAVNASTLNNQDLLVTGPGGYSAAATLTSTGLSNSSSITATYSIPAPSGGWTSTSDGSYTIALQANQVADTSGNFAAAGNLGTFSVNIAATTTGTGSLSGQQSTAAASYNLTSLGTEDWAHWGRSGAFGNFDHKATGGSKISNVTVVGSGASSGGYWNPARISTWTDGTPTATDSGDSGYIWSNGATNTGFQFTVPASTTTQTLYVYAGGSGTVSSLTAHLSDNSAPDYTVTASGSGSYTNFYTITFKAASAGQTLTITLLKTATLTPGGSVDLIAAALA